MLNSWFMGYVLGRTPEGIPNDFLSRGAESLLVFDSVIVDRHALDSELEVADQWTTSAIFREMQRAGLFDVREFEADVIGLAEPYRADATWVATDRAQRLADRKRAPMSIPPELLSLNHFIFTQLAGAATLRYDYHAAHLRLGDRIREYAQRLPAPPPGEEDLRVAADAVTPVLRILLPPIDLVPPLSEQQREVMRANVRDERRQVTRLLLGDPAVTIDVYRDERMGGAFAASDSLIDTPERRFEAMRRFERLMLLRERTRDARRDAQRILASVMRNERTLEDVLREAAAVRAEIEAHLDRAWRPTTSAVVQDSGLFLRVLTAIVALANPAVGAVTAGIELVRAWRASAENDLRREYERELRRRAPFYWISRIASESLGPDSRRGRATRHR
jgi:hypothetical protein